MGPTEAYRQRYLANLNVASSSKLTVETLKEKNEAITMNSTERGQKTTHLNKITVNKVFESAQFPSCTSRNISVRLENRS